MTRFISCRWNFAGTPYTSRARRTFASLLSNNTAEGAVGIVAKAAPRNNGAIFINQSIGTRAFLNIGFFAAVWLRIILPGCLCRAQLASQEVFGQIVDDSFEIFVGSDGSLVFHVVHLVLPGRPA